MADIGTEWRNTRSDARRLRKLDSNLKTVLLARDQEIVLELLCLI
jgi:hypothetical protein